jgi:hypothetical protein
MDDIDALLQNLNKQMIENAAAIDPSIKEKVEADRREIEEHDRRLEAERAAAQQKEPPKTAWHNLFEKLAGPKAS